MLEDSARRIWQDRVHDHVDLVVESFGFIAVIEGIARKLKALLLSFHSLTTVVRCSRPFLSFINPIEETDLGKRAHGRNLWNERIVPVHVFEVGHIKTCP